MHRSLNEFKFRPDTTTYSIEISALERLKKMMYNVVNTLAPLYLIGSSSFFHVMRAVIISRTSLKFGQIGQWTVELAALERLEKFPKTYNGKTVVTTPAPSFLIESSSFLQVTRICIKAWMSSKFGQIPAPTPELSALERLKSDV